MLIRICVLTASPELGERVAGSLRQPDVLVQVETGAGPELWQRACAESSDLLVASPEVVPRPVAAALAAAKAAPDEPEVVILSAGGDPEERAAFQAAGAFAVVDVSVPEPSLRKAFSTLVRRRREALLGRLRAEHPPEEPLAGPFESKNPAMRKLLALARRVATGDSSLLIVGETGVGKEWLARAVHEDGPRAGGPFVAINCAALPAELVESELFGHEAGAFTGAVRARRGQFEVAHRGTLFLDELTEMPLASQAKLLRAIQEREIRRLGADGAVKIDVRVMAATNRDPVRAIRDRALREDLYYRLSVVTLEIPPLRERPEDIPGIMRILLPRLREQIRKPRVQRVGSEVADAMRRYDWPGNIRELANVLERAILLASGEEIELADLPETVARAGTGQSSSGLRSTRDRLDLPFAKAREEVLDDFERDYLAHLLERTGGRVGEAAQLAQIDQRTLYNKMKRYGLLKEAFRTV